MDKKIRYHTSIILVLCTPLILSFILLLIFILPLINAITGAYSTTSPFSCGANCNGGYELSGYNATYCYNNPVECYNTIDNCRDGSNYDFEFVNNIYVTDLNGTNFTGGHTVNVTVEFDCDSDGDTISISYNNGSGFRVLFDDTCSVSALVNKTYSFVLDEKQGNHTVRATIVYNGGTQMICGYNYDTTFTDTDDVTFFVHEGPDTENPRVLGVSPNPGTVYNQSYGLIITISANITDNENVSSVRARVEWDSYNYTLDLNYVSGNLYSGNFTNITELTRYNVTIIANDTSNNVNNSETTYFTINSTTNITITSPSNRELLPYDDINLRFTIDYGYNADIAMYSLDNGANTTVNDKLSIGFTQSDQNGSIGESDNAYNNLSMSFKPSENMSVRVVALSLKRNSSGTSGSQVQIRTDNLGQPSNIVLAYGNITNTSVSTNYSFVNITLNTTVNLTESTTYWLFLTPNGSSTDFYTWEASNDGLYDYGNYSNNNSLDLLFVIYDEYKYNTTLTNISKGIHKIIVYANSTTMNPIKSQLIQFGIDDTPPNIITVSYNPNTTTDIDPNVVINVSTNITEELQVAEVLLQYKQSNENSFTNTTMQNTSGLYQGNFTPNTENNWTFRIYARDNSNNTAYSDNFTINVSYEYSWNRTPPRFNTTSAFLNTNTTVGNITINNSADITLTFNISKIVSTVPKIYFNNTESSLVFNLSAGNTTIIGVIATGQSIESEQEVGIRIKPTQAAANPDYLFTNFTLVSYVSGPYLDVDITEYDSTVSQEQSRVKLTATIINIGNETANNISAYWSLPSDWSPKSNLSFNYSSLGPGQQVVFTRYVNIGANAETGNHTIIVYVSCAEGKNDSDQRNVSVSASGGEETAPPPSRGGGGGGALLLPRTSKLGISIADEVEIMRGTNHTLSGSLDNTGEIKLENLSISLEGFPVLHYKIKPGSMSELGVNTSKSFSLFINVPEYFGSGKHEASLVVKALAENKWKEFSKDIIIIVVTEDKAEAFQCFENAELRITELEKEGIGTQKLSQKLGYAKRSYNTRDYSDANNLCQGILSDAELAISVKEKIASINSKYSGLGREIPELGELIRLVQDAFMREDYELASRRAEQAEFLLNLKEQEVQQTISYKWGVLRKYWVQIICVLIVLAVISVFIYSSTSLRAVSMRVRVLEERREVVRNKIKETQKKYFVKKELPARLYKKEMEHHRSSLIDIEKKKYELRLKRLKIISGRKLKDFETIRQEAYESKKELQRKYFVEKSIDKNTFKKLLLGFDSILQDIDRRIELRKEKKVKKES